MTQQRGATTYFLFLKSLPHCARLISDQTFWEFCRETEEQFKFSFITDKPLKTGGRKSALRKGKIAGALGLQPHTVTAGGRLPQAPGPAPALHPAAFHRKANGASSFTGVCPAHPAKMERSIPPLKTQVPFPLWSLSLAWWRHLSPYLAGKHIPYFKGQTKCHLVCDDYLRELWSIQDPLCISPNDLAFLLTSEFFF